MGIVYVVIFIILPYGLEQFVYWRFAGKKKQATQPEEVSAVISGYSTAYIWDFAHFAVLVYAIYWLVWQMESLTAFEALGLLLFVGGVALRIWSLRELGEFYDSDSVVRRDHQIVRSGPYRFLRHPLHWGSDLQIIGLAVLAPVWLALPAIIAALAVTIYRNHLEDKALNQHLGTAYQDYFEVTWDPVDWLFSKARVLEDVTREEHVP